MEIKAKIADVESGFPEVEVKAVITDRGVELYIDGYGTMAMENGHGSPVYLEVIKGVPKLYVWADIQKEDPTDAIGLQFASEKGRE